MRIDVYLVEKGYCSSRSRARRSIDAGLVTVDGSAVKASYDVADGDIVELAEAQEYASIGKFKLKKALDEFKITVAGKSVADIGASNGGFTELLLERGARKVYAIDVGENQLAPHLRSNTAVSIMDRTNARLLDNESFPETIDVVVCDVSFISLELIIPAAAKILDSGGEAVFLIKPQFEAGKRFLSKRGVVTDEKIRLQVCDRVRHCAENCGFCFRSITAAPYPGKGKNTEYLLYVTKGR